MNKKIFVSFFLTAVFVFGVFAVAVPARAQASTLWGAAKIQLGTSASTFSIISLVKSWAVKWSISIPEWGIIGTRNSRTLNADFLRTVTGSGLARAQSPSDPMVTITAVDQNSNAVLAGSNLTAADTITFTYSATDDSVNGSTGLANLGCNGLTPVIPGSSVCQIADFFPSFPPSASSSINYSLAAATVGQCYIFDAFASDTSSSQGTASFNFCVTSSTPTITNQAVAFPATPTPTPPPTISGDGSSGNPLTYDYGTVTFTNPNISISGTINGLNSSFIYDFSITQNGNLLSQSVSNLTGVASHSFSQAITLVPGPNSIVETIQCAVAPQAGCTGFFQVIKLINYQPAVVADITRPIFESQTVSVDGTIVNPEGPCVTVPGVQQDILSTTCRYTVSSSTVAISGRVTDNTALRSLTFTQNPLGELAIPNFNFLCPSVNAPATTSQDYNFSMTLTPGENVLDETLTDCAGFTATFKKIITFSSESQVPTISEVSPTEVNANERSIFSASVGGTIAGQNRLVSCTFDPGNGDRPVSATFNDFDRGASVQAEYAYPTPGVFPAFFRCVDSLPRILTYITGITTDITVLEAIASEWNPVSGRVILQHDWVSFTSSGEITGSSASSDPMLGAVQYFPAGGSAFLGSAVASQISFAFSVPRVEECFSRTCQIGTITRIDTASTGLFLSDTTGETIPYFDDNAVNLNLVAGVRVVADVVLVDGVVTATNLRVISAPGAPTLTLQIGDSRPVEYASAVKVCVDPAGSFTAITDGNQQFGFFNNVCMDWDGSSTFATATSVLPSLNTQFSSTLTFGPRPLVEGTDYTATLTGPSPERIGYVLVYASLSPNWYVGDIQLTATVSSGEEAPCDPFQRTCLPGGSGQEFSSTYHVLDTVAPTAINDQPTPQTVTSPRFNISGTITDADPSAGLGSTFNVSVAGPAGQTQDYTGTIGLGREGSLFSAQVVLFEGLNTITEEFCDKAGNCSTVTKIITLVTDSDGDGVLDPEDMCPTVPGKGAPSEYVLDIQDFRSTYGPATSAGKKVYTGNGSGGIVEVLPGADGKYHIALKNGANYFVDTFNVTSVPKGAWLVKRNGSGNLQAGLRGDGLSGGYVYYKAVATVLGGFDLQNVGSNPFEKANDGTFVIGNPGQDELKIVGAVITANSTVTSASDYYTLKFQDYHGCPFADFTTVTRHTVDQSKSGICGYLPNGKPRPECKGPVENVEVKVYDRDNVNFKTAYTSRPLKKKLDIIFNNNIGLLGSCTSNATGECTIGEDHGGKFLVIAKLVDGTKQIYSGKFKDFKDCDRRDDDDEDDDDDHDDYGRRSDLGSNTATVYNSHDDDDDDHEECRARTNIAKNINFLKIISKNGSFTYQAGDLVKIIGSELSVAFPEYTVWENDVELYPFIFTSDSEWTADICLSVPAGYNISAVYDEEGNAMATSQCVQTFLEGETKVILFEVSNTASSLPAAAFLSQAGGSEPNFSFSLSTKHVEAPLTGELAEGGFKAPTGVQETSQTISSSGVRRATKNAEDAQLKAAIAPIAAKVEAENKVIALAEAAKIAQANVGVNVRFDYNLTIGSRSELIRALQVYLNTHGFIVASAGAGSRGQETNYFGPRTREALRRFQDAHRAEILTPIGLQRGTGVFGARTRAYINANQ